MSTSRPFSILGLQQIAVGGLDKQKLKHFWVDILGLNYDSTYVSEKENVDEDICSAGHGAFKVEVDLMQPLDPEKKPKVHEPALNHVARAAYQTLGLESYFTAGEKEVRAWTIPIGATAPQAAGVIHTDFEKGFIRAEVINYDDYVTLGSEQAVKSAGKMSVEGKEYVVKDGDIMHFLFNV